ncbi:hypothetical protein D3C81_1329980 [compost metagenome]
MSKIYKGPGGSGKSRYWDMMPLADMRAAITNRLTNKAFKVIVKNYELISEKGEVIISTQSLPSIELVEGAGINLSVDNDKGQIIISSKSTTGNIGGKEVDEATIGDGKVLSYDEQKDKLVYIDITDVIQVELDNFVQQELQRIVEETVDMALEQAIEQAIEEAIGGLNRDNYYRETATGLVNGTNKQFTIQYSPIIGKEQVYLNGMLLENGSVKDYVIDDKLITLNYAPEVDSVVTVVYFSDEK